MFDTKEMPREEAMLKERPVRDLSGVIDDVTKHLLNDFEAHEQKEILLAVKKNISGHYEQLRQNHIMGAETFAKKIEMFNSF